MNETKILLLIAAVVSAFSFTPRSFAQSVVDQGKPGNKGPWPVTCTNCSGGGSSDGGSSSGSSVGPDGGAVVTQTSFCALTSPNKITTVGTSATPVPAAATAGRLYEEICNSLQNTGNPIVKCRTDGTNPVAAAGNAGDVLGIGDCIRYTAPSSVVPACISDAAGTNVTSYECVPIHF